MRRLFALVLLISINSQSQNIRRVVGFFTGKNDRAHISFVHEANCWLDSVGRQHSFQYDSTSDWRKLNPDFLSSCALVIFLDTRPEDSIQRKVFEDYMKKGGGWLGFHFAGFALTPSAYPQNWDWYHKEFIGAGQYKSNTWRPTSAVLKVEDTIHPTAMGLSSSFSSAPNEWYRWQNDLTKNPRIKILLSIHPKSFPLGTGPKAHEIWHEGYYPVAWTNKNYKMVYLNMGHNDIDYDHGTNKELSSTFQSASQNRFITNSLLWLLR